MARIWKIRIPVRPKAVQSVRGGKRGFYVDPAVRRWKNQIRPYIASCCEGAPTKLPLSINHMHFIYKCPANASKAMVEYIKSGGCVTYIGAVDVSDNLAKGLIDTCAGLVFENDRQIWKSNDRMKMYGLADGMYIEFEETPGAIMIDGKFATGDKIGSTGLFVPEV